MTDTGSSLSPDDYDDDYAGEPSAEPDYSFPSCCTAHRTRSNQHLTFHTHIRTEDPTEEQDKQ